MIIGKIIYSIFLDPFGRVDLPDSKDRIEEFREAFESEFGVIHGPFYSGSFADVKKEIKGRPDALLVIYFFAPKHVENGRIGKEIIADPTVANLLDGPTIVFWPMDLRIKTYYKLARNLGYTEVFPGFLFLSNAGHKLEILKMLSGLDKRKFIDTVTDCLSMIEVKRIMSADDPSNNGPLEGQSLRADQDRAYLASLEADKKKEAERRALEEAKRKAEELALEKEKEIAALEEARLVKIEALKKVVQNKCLGSCSDSKAIILSIQFAANGKRATSRFSPSTPVKDVFDYCAAQFEMLPDEISLRIPMPFQLINNDPSSTLESIGIASNVKLVVEKITRYK